MSPQAMKLVRIGVGVAFSVVCLWLAIGQAQVGELVAALTQVNYWWVGPILLGNVVSLLGRGYRWRVLLSGRGTPAEYFWAQAIGCLLTNVLPLRAGEAGRVLVVSRRVGLPLVHVGATLVLERAADLLVVLGLLASLLLIMDVPWQITATGLFLATALVGALIGVAVLTVFGERLTPLVRLVAARLPGRLSGLAVDTYAHLLAALAPLRDARVLPQVVLWTAVVWGVGIATFWASIEAVAPGARLIEAAVGITAVSVGISLPSSPGFVGIYQYVGQVALATPFPDRFTPASALAVGLLGHAVYYVSTTVLGMVGLARFGLSFSAVRASEPPATDREPVEAAPAPAPQAS